MTNPKTPLCQRVAVKNFKEKSVIRKNIDFNLNNEADVAILDALERDERTIINVLRHALVRELNLDIDVPTMLKNPQKEAEMC